MWVMTLTVVTKVQIGFSLAAISFLTIGTAELLMHCEPLGTHSAAVCGLLGGTGLFMWLAGRALSGSSSSEGTLVNLTEPRYWGLLLALSALLVYSHSTYRRLSARPPVQPIAVVEKAPPPVSFPPLLVESIVFQGARSTALVNGKVVAIGDEIENAEIVAIGKDHVSVSFRGQTNLIYLGKPLR